MKSFLKNNALFESMFIGIFLGILEGVGLFHITLPSWLLPSLIFLMLFFTFCKINPIDLRLHKWHWVLLAFQVVVATGLFYAIQPFSLLLAQGVMMCVLMPSATAAPIIAGKLGGSIETLTSYTLLSSFATAILVPLLFPLFNADLHVTFLQQFTDILAHISPLLMGPFVAAWLVRLAFNASMKAQHKSARFELKGIWASLPFWIWVFTLVVLMDKTTLSLFAHEGSWWPVILLFVGALFTCLLQFFVGKKVGERWPSVAHGKDYHDVLVHPALASDDPRQLTRISAGQALGQKNTTLAIWMAQAYLLPISSLAPAAYILWQNLFNSWQLSHAAKGKRV